MPWRGEVEVRSRRHHIPQVPGQTTFPPNPRAHRRRHQLGTRRLVIDGHRRPGCATIRVHRHPRTVPVTTAVEVARRPAVYPVVGERERHRTVPAATLQRERHDQPTAARRRRYRDERRGDGDNREALKRPARPPDHAGRLARVDVHRPERPERAAMIRRDPKLGNRGHPGNMGVIGRTRRRSRNRGIHAAQESPVLQALQAPDCAVLLADGGVQSRSAWAEPLVEPGGAWNRSDGSGWVTVHDIRAIPEIPDRGREKAPSSFIRPA